jgi:hypothetical protein
MRSPEYVAPTQDPTRQRTSAAVSRKIDRETRGTIDELKTADAIRARISELEREWSLDRTLMAVFSALGAVSSGQAMLSLARRGKLGFWGALFFTQLGFLGYHAAKGWCPPVSVLRRLGVRTAHEICAERVALEGRLAQLGA